MINQNGKLKEQFLVLEANAGSGKTFSLVSRYLGLLFLNVSPEKIFALTFTKKATKEMYDRVINSLKNPQTSGEILKIAQNLNLSKQVVEQKSKEHLERLLNSDVKISTIDSFGHSILKKFSHYLDIIPNFKVVERIDEKRFKSIFLEKVYSSKYRVNILNIEELDKKSKIDTIFSELKRFYVKEVELHSLKSQFKILTVHNNLKVIEKSILELAYPISEWLLDSEHNLSKSAKNVLTFSNIEELLDAGKTWLTKDRLDQYTYFKKAFKENDSTTIQTSFEKLKELLESYFERKRELIFKNMFQLFEFYIQERENFIKREAKFSFDDINHFLVKLILDKEIDSKFIYFRLDSSIEHFLIDEFQDTSLLQYRVLQPIIDDILSGGSSVDKSFFYVGDKMQSLYRFRGGFSNLFNHIQDKHKNITRNTLPKNYRSKENIIDFTNSLFSTKQTIGSKKQIGGSVFVKEFENPIDKVVAEVQNLIKLGIELNNIAVICSKNSEIDQLTKLLLEKNIDIQAETNQSLIEHPSVKAVTQYILYLYHIRESGSDFYLKNFQTILGIDPKEVFENRLNLDLEKLSLYQIGIEIIRYFQLFDGDENSIIFLDSLQNIYLDIDDFIYNFHLEAGKISKTKRNGVNLITIHKSKGLEFKNVIFIDYSSKSRDSINILLLYSGIDTEDIVWSVALDNKIYSRYLKVLESEKKLQNQDNINRLYVALTRAKNSLTILKREKDSSLDLVEIDKVDISKFQNSLEVEKSIVQDLELITSEQEFDFQENFYGYQNDKSVSNSDEVKKDFDLDEEIESFKRKEFGTALHSTIEIMNSFIKENLDIALENVRNRFYNLLDSDFKDIQKRVFSMISDSKFKNLISEGTVTKESGYIFKGKNYFIDMIIERDSEIIVCDFKLSENPKFAKEYQKQIQNYVDIIKSLDKKGKQIRGCLIYPYENGTKIKYI